MKKFLSLFLVLALLLATLAIFASCDDADKNDKDDDEISEDENEDKDDDEISEDKNNDNDDDENSEDENEDNDDNENSEDENEDNDDNENSEDENEDNDDDEVSDEAFKTVEGIQNNPTLALSNALSSAVSDYFLLNSSSKSVFDAMADKGEINIEFSGNDDLNLGVKEFRYSAFFDSNQKKSAAFSKFVADGVSATSNVYFDNGCLVVANGKTPIKIDFNNFAEKFNDSAFKDWVMSSSFKTAVPDELQETLEMIEGFMTSSKDDAVKLLDKYLEYFISDISSANVENDDETYACTKISFVINTDTLKAFVAEFAKPFGEELKNELFDEIEHEFEGTSFTMDVYVSKKTASIVKLDLSAEFAVLASRTQTYDENTNESQIEIGPTPTIDFSMFIGENTIEAELDVKDGDNKLTVKGAIEKVTNGNTTTFTVSADATIYERSNSDSIDLIDAEIVCNASTGDVVLSMQSEGQKISLTWNVEANKDTVAIIVKSLTLTEGSTSSSINFEKFNINFGTTPTIPTAPEDAKDLFDLTEEELKELLSVSSTEPEYYPNESEEGDYFYDKTDYDSGYDFEAHETSNVNDFEAHETSNSDDFEAHETSNGDDAKHEFNDDYVYAETALNEPTYIINSASDSALSISSSLNGSYNKTGFYSLADHVEISTAKIA